MTTTGRASDEPQDGERLHVEILGDARDDDAQLRALQRTVDTAIALPRPPWRASEARRDARRCAVQRPAALMIPELRAACTFVG